MGQLKVEKKTHCETCQVKFSIDLPYHAMNLCYKCYTMSKNKKKVDGLRVNSKERYKNCLECKYEFGTLGHKDKLVTYGSSGLCKRCYARLYNKKANRFCAKCERQMSNTSKPICRVCFELEKDEFYANNPKAKQPRSYKDKLKVIKTEITNEQFELVRRLLTKFKIGMYSMVDYFRVADIYIDIYEHEVFLDAYSEDEQVAIMLKRLKDIWLFNKDLRIVKAAKLRDYLEKKKKRLKV